jgi:hypothetical protein
MAAKINDCTVYTQIMERSLLFDVAGYLCAILRFIKKDFKIFEDVNRSNNL